MTQPLTIQATLRLPAAFMRAGRSPRMEEIEEQLEDYGLMPLAGRERRWRLAHERPGGYILTFTVALADENEEGR